MGNPLISIVVPMYNAQRFLTKDYMVYSIINQDYKDFELILINDASKDDTLREINNIARSNSRIKVIDLEKNSGEAIARDVGINNAIGEYVLIFDQDDRVDEDLLSVLANTAGKYAYPDMIVFQAFMHSMGGKKVTGFKDNNPRNVLLNQEYIRNTILAENIGMTDTSGYALRLHWRIMYKKEMLDAYNVRYDPLKRKDEDQLFLNESLFCAKNLVIIDDIAYHWIRWDGSSTGMYSPMFDNLLDNLHKYKKRFGNYYDFDCQNRLQYNVTKFLPDCYDFILCHENDKGVIKKAEIMKILQNNEVINWYKSVRNISGQPLRIKKAIEKDKTYIAYMLIDLEYSSIRLRRLGKRILSGLGRYE